MRQWLSFSCDGVDLAAALDDAPGSAGLLTVSGGNETLSGSHGNMAKLAARVAEAGHPVFRYDRRGVGDAAGENGAFETGGPDLAAAVSAFRAAAPAVTRIVGFGNCDGASTLALFGRDLGIHALVLANPWVIETVGEMPPAAAIKARYRQKLLDPKEWLRLLRGGVDIGKLFKGLRAASIKAPTGGLAERMRGAIATAPCPVRVVLARRDATALAFADAWGNRTAAHVAVVEIDSNSHSFARPADAEALLAELLEALRKTS
jgi:exosortase A-associated hydrolase 1